MASEKRLATCNILLFLLYLFNLADTGLTTLLCIANPEGEINPLWRALLMEGRVTTFILLKSIIGGIVLLYLYFRLPLQSEKQLKFTYYVLGSLTILYIGLVLNGIVQYLLLQCR